MLRPTSRDILILAGLMFVCGSILWIITDRVLSPAVHAIERSR